MRKKILVFLTLCLVFCSCIVTLMACGDKSTHTDGLIFELTNDGLGYEVVGYNGDSTEINIDSSYNGKPVVRIGDYAFSGFDRITRIEIPNSVISVGNNAFRDCYSLLYNIKGVFNYLGNKNNPYLYLASANDNTISSAIIDSDCKIIGSNAFDNYNHLTTVTMGDSITCIGSYAFSSCYNLTNIALGNSLKEIGDAAFSYCRSLENIELPTSVTILGNDVFSSCSRLRSIIIPSGITSIGNNTFFYCPCLTSIEIPNTIKNIGINAFGKCDQLKKVNFLGTIDEWVEINFDDTPLYYSRKLYINDELVKDVVLTTATKISYNAFYCCRSLESIVIPNSVTSIGDFAFFDCQSLTSIEMPNSIKTIGAMAFNCCYYLRNIEIPENVASIGDSAFKGCPYLTCNVKDGLKYLGNKNNQFLYLLEAEFDTITNANIDAGCRFISSYAFEYCRSLKSVRMPDAIVSIGSKAFYHCSELKSINISKSLKYIGMDSFHMCASLTKIVIPNSVEFVGAETFRGCESLIIYCETGSQPSGWSGMWNYYDNPVVWGYKE